jgi:DNA-binding CsgD family transcriptional regulator
MQVAKFREDFSLVEEYYRRANREFDLSWRPLTRSYFDIAYADTLTRIGRLDDARKLLEALASLGPLLRSRRTWVEVGLANICFHQGEIELANEHVGAVREALRSRPDTWYPMLRFWQAKVEIDMALNKGELAAAVRGAKTIEELTTQCGVYDPNSAPWHNTAIAAYMANGQFSEVRRIIDILSGSDTFSYLKTPKAIVSHARALLSQAEGDTEDAEIDFNNAISIYRELRMPLDEANTLLSYGSFIRKHFGAKLARPVLISALELTNSLGALTLSNQIVAELRLAQGRVSKKRSKSTILTPAQERVQAYVLNGLSNRDIANTLFVSPRTIEHHISALLKLHGVQNRKELRQVLANPYPPKMQKNQLHD